jgi:hypothetical protein
MATGWEYSILLLDTEGTGNWEGTLTVGSQVTEVTASSLTERLAFLNKLGQQGWELVGQSATGSANGPTRSYIYGWQWTFKRPL